MSTNFYIHKNVCEYCGRFTEEHIGKSSVGYRFLFQGSDDIQSIESWIENVGDNPIYDQYGKMWTLDELLVVIEIKRNGRPNALETRLPGLMRQDVNGNVFDIGNWS